MIAIALPNGDSKNFERPITGLTVAESISKSLAKAAVAVRVNGELRDLTRNIEDNAAVEIITRDTPEGLEVIRHDTAHVFAEAIKELYPEAQIKIGPAFENGFYYDIYCEKSITPDDFEKIEKRMHEIVARDEEFTREVWERNKAIAFFKSIGEEFKAQIIQDLPEDAEITLYRQGNFIDLCRGPHLPSTGKIGKAFKLMKVAGAYWRGDSNNQMLQRIYGTAWANEGQLQDYLTFLEEAEKRDHRKIGRAMDLFHVQEAAVGSVFWHPKGWQLYRTLQEYIRQRLGEENYVEVNTPIMVDRSLWEKSGHWEKFRESMFTVENDEDRVYAIKPMNCPCHVEIFKQGTKSYRDLPMRMAEFGNCHRNEPSGALHGIMRVRGFTQDDAHIFCTEEQILSETIKFTELLKSIYLDLGFPAVMVKFSDRPAVRAGTDETWDRAEMALREGTEASNLDYVMNPGEGAFYGPKLEFVLKDTLGRDWQCGTFQVDFVLPERLNASYMGEDGKQHRPVMLHRAILGSFERFIGILIEHYAGNLPLWLAPVQVVVTPITDDLTDYACEVVEQLKAIGVRVNLDSRNEKISYKIRDLSNQKTPIILVVGKREAEINSVAMRRLGSQDQEVLDINTLLGRLEVEAFGPLRRKIN